MQQQASRFLFDLWKASAYYDFRSSFSLPDTFYVSKSRIDWLFTSPNSGKLLRKKQPNATSEVVAGFFAETAKARGFPEPEEGSFTGIIAEQFFTNGIIAYFQELDLAGVYDILSDHSIDEQNPKILQLSFSESQQKSSEFLLVDWQKGSGVSVRKRINQQRNNYTFSVTPVSSRVKLVMNDLCTHIANGLNLIYCEQGKLERIEVFMSYYDSKFYVLGCTAQQFDKDRYLATKLSYEISLLYPNEALHSQHGFNKAVDQVKTLEKAKKTQQCPSCQRFSDKFRTVTQASLLAVTMRKALRELQFQRDNKQMQVADLTLLVKVCEDCASFVEVNQKEANRKKEVEDSKKKQERAQSGRKSSEFKLSSLPETKRNDCTTLHPKRDTLLKIELPIPLKKLSENDSKQQLSTQESDRLNQRSQRSKSVLNHSNMQHQQQQILIFDNQTTTDVKEQIRISPKKEAISEIKVALPIAKVPGKISMKFALKNIKKDVKKQVHQANEQELVPSSPHGYLDNSQKENAKSDSTTQLDSSSQSTEQHSVCC